MNKRTAHNLTWAPILIIGVVANILGLAWFIHEEPWLLDQTSNEVLIQTSFSDLFSKKINIGLPLYLTTIYRFFGLYLMTTGSLIIVFVYVTRLGTKTARNCIFLILFVSLLGIYFLVLNYLSSSPLMPILYFLTFCLSLSVFFSKHLPD